MSEEFIVDVDFGHLIKVLFCAFTEYLFSPL